MQRRFPEGLGLLDPVEDMGIKDEAFKTLIHVRAPAVSPRVAAREILTDRLHPRILSNCV